MISLSPPPVPVPATSERLHNFKHCSHYHNPGTLLPVFAAPRLISGPLHSGIARERAPTTVRAMWGTDGTSNAIHVSVDMESADKERLYAAVNMSSQEMDIFPPSCMLHVCIDRLSVVHIHYSRCSDFRHVWVVNGGQKHRMMHHQKAGGMGMTGWPTWSPGGDQDGFPWGQLEIGENLMLSEAGCHQPCGAPWAWHIHDIKMMNV